MELIPIIYYLVLIIAAYALLITFIERTFFTNQIHFKNSNQLEKIKNFAEKFHWKYNITYSDLEDGSGFVATEYGLAGILKKVIKYKKLSEFNKGYNVLENDFFIITHNIKNITIKNKENNKSIIKIKYYNEIWKEAEEKIDNSLNLNDFLLSLADLKYITDNEILILCKTKHCRTKRCKKLSINNCERNKRKILDINNCSKQQLEELPGVTVIIANKILKYRNDNKGFKTIDEFWQLTKLNKHQIEIIENLVVIKIKKIKNKIYKAIEIIIKKNIERIVDI